jgi:hypothetical protein
MVQDRIQLAAPFLVGGVVTGSRKQIAKAEKAAYQRPATRSQKAKALTRSRTSNDGFGIVLEDNRLGGDSAHGGARVTRQSGVPSHGLARPSRSLDCRDRHWPAASEAAHVPTVAPPTACPISCDLFGIRQRARRAHVGCGAAATTLWRGCYGCGATMTRSEVVDKITKAMQSSAPITTASVDIPPALTGTSGG